MKRLFDLLKKGMTSMTTFFKGLTVKKWVILSLSVFFVLLISFSFFKKSTINNHYDGLELMNDYSNTYLTKAFSTPLYSELVQSYKDNNKIDVNQEKTILTGDMQGLVVNSNHTLYGEAALNYKAYSNQDQDIHLLTKGEDIVFTNPLTTSGLVYFALDVYDVENAIDQAQIAITINGESPFYESQTLVIPSKWQLESNDFKLDRYQNEIQPSSLKVYEWRKHEVNDYRGMHPGLFAYDLKPGDVIRIHYVNQELLIGQFYFVKEKEIPAYESYLNQMGNHEVIDEKNHNICKRNALSK